ncbi:purine nucleoside phosphorylase [Caballeronia peredens]|nr:purine nucleoside phosphorylase [Caballeronia peredens]
MNAIAKVIVSLAVVAAPTLVFAQSDNVPLTRAQVRAELAQLERAGYSPATGEDANYPSDIQAAEAKVAAAQQSAKESNEAYGGAHAGGAASGSGSMGMPTQHGSKSASDCVGPAGFCTPFFGS